LSAGPAAPASPAVRVGTIAGCLAFGDLRANRRGRHRPEPRGWRLSSELVEVRSGASCGGVAVRQLHRETVRAPTLTVHAQSLSVVQAKLVPLTLISSWLGRFVAPESYGDTPVSHQGHLIDFAIFGGVRDDDRPSLADNMQFTRPDAVPMKIEGRFWSAPAGSNAVAVTTDGLCLGKLEVPKARGSITSLAPAQACSDCRPGTMPSLERAATYRAGAELATVSECRRSWR
jgi:hypothetical protein